MRRAGQRARVRVKASTVTGGSAGDSLSCKLGQGGASWALGVVLLVLLLCPNPNPPDILILPDQQDKTVPKHRQDKIVKVMMSAQLVIICFVAFGVGVLVVLVIAIEAVVAVFDLLLDSGASSTAGGSWGLQAKPSVCCCCFHSRIIPDSSTDSSRHCNNGNHIYYTFIRVSITKITYLVMDKRNNFIRGRRPCVASRPLANCLRQVVELVGYPTTHVDNSSLAMHAPRTFLQI